VLQEDMLASNKAMRDVEREFEINQAKLERAQQTALQEGTIDANKALQDVEREFEISQAKLDRVQQTALQTGTIDANKALQDAQTEHSAAEAKFDRTQQTLMQTSAQEQQTALQTSVQKHDKAESALDRTQQKAMRDVEREFEINQARLDRLLESRAIDYQKLGINVEQSWRDADRDLKKQLDERSLAMAETDLKQEDKYREAVIHLDTENLKYQRDAQEQQAELSRWDIFLRALTMGAYDEWPGDEDPNLPTFTPLGKITPFDWPEPEIEAEPESGGVV
jgi:hypothetical protein